MEKQNDTSIKKLENQLVFLISFDESLSKLIRFELFEKLIEQIDKSKISYLLSTKSRLSNKNLKLNCHCVVIKIYESFSRFSIDEVCFTLFYNSNEKYFKTKLENLKKIQEQQNQLKLKLSQQSKNKLKINSNQSLIKNGITGFQKNILEMDGFNSFNFSQIIFHKKGESFIKSYIYNQNDEIQQKIVTSEDITSYLKLLNLIKKSKNKKFDQSKLNIPILELVGFFGAITYSINSYNIILLIGRNEFLSYENDEISKFNVKFRNLQFALEYFIKVIDSEKENFINNILFQNLSDKAIINLDGKKYYNIKNSHKNSFSKKYSLKKFSLNVEKDKDDHLGHAEIFFHQKILILGELLNNLNHELSNPLFGLKLSTDFLIDSDIFEDKDYLKDIKNYLIRSEKIIDNLKNLYTSKNNLNKIDFKDLINETFTMAKSELINIHREVNCKDYQKNFITNPTLISQVLFNLIINSVQAINEDKLFSNDSKKYFIKISVDSKKNFTDIIIEDNGIGINKSGKSFNSIFDPFYTTKKDGTGLGLTICKKLLSKIDGFITLENSVDTTKFKVSLSHLKEEISD